MTYPTDLTDLQCADCHDDTCCHGDCPAARDLVKDRARGLMHLYPGYTFGAVFQATILLGVSTTPPIQMQEIAGELDGEQA